MAQKKATKKQAVPTAAIAAGVVAAGAAAAAGYYFYGSKNAKQHRKAAVKWAHDMKREVVKEAKKLKKLDEDVIHTLIDHAAGIYKGTSGVTKAELDEAVAELKANWRKLKTEARASGSRTKAATKSAVKTAKKKPAKKSAKK